MGYQMDNSRVRLLQVYKLIMGATEALPVTVKQIMDVLDETDRRVIYKDIDAIIEAGFDVFYRIGRNNQFFYYKGESK